MRPTPPKRDRPRHAQIEQRLRRQPTRAARLEQDALARPAAASSCADAAHGLPLKCCRLAATTRPVRGTSTLPMTRNMCGRSFGSRPRALVRLFGSCPNVRYGAPAIGADLRARGGRSRWRPAAPRPSKTYTSRTPASRRTGVFRRPSRARCTSASTLWIRQQEAAIGRGS